VNPKAEQLAAIGIQQALAARPSWSQLADKWLLQQRKGFVFTSEDLTNEIGYPTEENSLNSNNAVGAKIRTWANAGITFRSSFTKSNNERSHGRLIAEWTKL